MNITTHDKWCSNTSLMYSRGLELKVLSKPNHSDSVSPKLDWNLPIKFVIDSWKCHHFLNYLFLGKLTIDKAVIHKYSRACQGKALRRGLETTNVNHSLGRKSKHTKRTCEYVHSVLTHTSSRRIHLVKTAAVAPFPSTVLQLRISTCRALEAEEKKSPAGHFKQQSAKLNNMRDQRSRSDILLFEPFSLLCWALACLQSPFHAALKLRTGLTSCAQQTVPFLTVENTMTFQGRRSHCCLFKGSMHQATLLQDSRLCTNRLLWLTHDFLWQFWWAELEKIAKSQ